MIDVALEVRTTSHMSAGMRTYAQQIAEALPRVAPDLQFARFGGGDNFDSAEQFAMPAWIARRRPRLVHYTTPFLPIVQPRPYIATIHDLIELRFPAYSKPKAQFYYRRICGPLVRRATRVVAPDRRVVDDLVAEFGIDRARARIVPLGYDPRWFAGLRAAEPLRPYVLYVGNHRRHKDLATLLAAWAQMPAGAAIDLKLTGPSDIPELAARHARTDAQLSFVGDLSEDELAAAYAGARAYVHPALIEGYGLPMLEAAAAGTAVIATATSVPAALATAAWTFAPGDVRALTGLLTRAAREPAAMERLGRDLQAVARPFTWDRCAGEIAAIYREILA